MANITTLYQGHVKALAYMCCRLMSVKRMRIMMATDFKACLLTGLWSAGQQSPPEGWRAVHDVKWRTSKHWGVRLQPSGALLFVTWQQHMGVQTNLSKLNSWLDDGFTWKVKLRKLTAEGICKYDIFYEVNNLRPGDELRQTRSTRWGPKFVLFLAESVRQSWQKRVGDASLVMGRILIYSGFLHHSSIFLVFTPSSAACLWMHLDTFCMITWWTPEAGWVRHHRKFSLQMLTVISGGNNAALLLFVL